MNRMFGWIFAVVFVASLAACGSDSTKDQDTSSTDQDCPDGQEWNPILKQCQDEGSPVGNNSTSNNSSSSNNGDDTTDPNANPNNTTTGPNNTTNNGTTGPNNHTSVELACGTGGLLGKTCAPSGEPLVAADVKVTGTDCETGEAFEVTARTDSEGNYEFDMIPSGRHTLEISTGSFNTSRQVVIQKDMVTDLTSAAEKVCLDQNVEIAVIGGSYDHVEGVLEDLNLDEYTMIGDDESPLLGGSSDASLAFLQDLNQMNQYDIVFINCGNLFSAAQAGGSLQAIYNNLRMYVAGGKSIYVSDLSFPFIEGAFPDQIDFYGDDATVTEAFKGYAPQTITADVMTTDLQTVLARDTATIEFPHDPPNVVNNNWAIAEGVGMDATAHLVGEAQLCAEGTGGIFGNPCPSADGTVAAAPLLVTYQDPSGGTVVFTSFHNERQAALNQDMEKILRFLIFQL